MARRKTTEVVEPVASPSLSEFSDKAASKAINKKIFGSPWTVYPIVLGLAVGVGGALIAAPVVAIAGLAGLAVGAGHVVVKCAQSGKMKFEYNQELERRIQEASEQRRRNVRPLLANCGNVQDARELVDQGVSQFDNVNEMFDGLLALLGKKLNEGEHAYGRYVGVADAGVNNVVQNLKTVTAIIEGIRAIKVDHIDRQIKRIFADGVVSEMEKPELEALKKRQELRVGQLNEARRLLTENEAILTVLGNLIAKVSAMETGKDGEARDPEVIMAELERMVNMTDILSSKRS